MCTVYSNELLDLYLELVCLSSLQPYILTGNTGQRGSSSQVSLTASTIHPQDGDSCVCTNLTNK